MKKPIHRFMSLWAAAAVIAGGCFFPLRAEAVNCSSLQNPLFIAGSSALEPLYMAIGKSLAIDPNNPVTLLYQKPGSCLGIAALGQSITTDFLYIDGTFDGVNVPTCTNDIAGGAKLDIALSDVFYDTCTGQTIAAPYKDFLGPVQAMIFAVPKASPRTAITAEEAYYLFGFGAAGQVTPWTSEANMCIRNKDSGTQQLLAAAIQVPAAKWKGQQNAASSNVLSCLAQSGASAPAQTIGILGADIYDSGSNRNTLTALAFRAFQQYLAYYPDSTPIAFDKRNVRDGHYVPFGYAHLITAVNAGGAPVNPRAQYLINLLQGNPVTPAPSFDVMTAIIKSGRLVLQCAMQVQRQKDGGDLSLYQPPTPCGCFYEATATGIAPAGCTACDASAPCTSGQCRFGFCEAR